MHLHTPAAFRKPSAHGRQSAKYQCSGTGHLRVWSVWSISGSGLYGVCGQQGSYAAQGGQAGHSKVLAVLGVWLRSVAGVRAVPLWLSKEVDCWAAGRGGN